MNNNNWEHARWPVRIEDATIKEMQDESERRYNYTMEIAKELGHLRADLKELKEKHKGDECKRN